MGRKKPARGRENRAGEAVRACNFCNVKQDFMQNRVRMDTWALPSEILWGVASLTRCNPIFFQMEAALGKRSFRESKHRFFR